jgi:hypothetical protein
MMLVSERWKTTYAGARVGILEMSAVANPETSPALDVRKQALEADLRSRFASLPLEDPVPEKLIERIAKFRAKEAPERARAKEASKKRK